MSPTAPPSSEGQQVNTRLAEPPIKLLNGNALERYGSRPDSSTPQERRSLPPIGTILARPILLVTCVALGALAGFMAGGGAEKYEATAVIEFSAAGNDIGSLRLEAQTLADTLITVSVIESAAQELDQPAAELASATTAKWDPESLLIDVVTTAESPDTAVARANAVSRAAIAALRASVAKRLGAATAEADSLLRGEVLSDPEAEAARRSQVGVSLGNRQEGLKGQTESWEIAKPAVEAKPAGLSRALSTAVGQAVGLFAGCLLAVLLGVRGLRAWSLGTLRRLAGNVQLLTPAQAPQIVGRMIEAGETYLAIVTGRGAQQSGELFAHDIERLLLAHGKSVTIVRPSATVDGEHGALLRSDAPTRVSSLVGTDVLIVILEAGTEAAAMLEGRTGFCPVVLIRRGRTPVADALSAESAFHRARPALVLAG